MGTLLIGAAAKSKVCYIIDIKLILNDLLQDIFRLYLRKNGSACHSCSQQVAVFLHFYHPRQTSPTFCRHKEKHRCLLWKITVTDIRQPAEFSLPG